MKIQRLNPGVRPMKGRRGSLVVTAFVIVVGMAMMVAGIQTMLKNQLDQTLTIKDISLAKTQVIYLAEMGVNHVMYIANSDAKIGAADPWPMAQGTTATFDFKNYVAMTKNVSGATATCTVQRTAAASFQCDATLYIPSVGTFTKRCDFSATQASPVWKLSAFQSY